MYARLLNIYLNHNPEANNPEVGQSRAQRPTNIRSEALQPSKQRGETTISKFAPACGADLDREPRSTIAQSNHTQRRTTCPWPAALGGPVPANTSVVCIGSDSRIVERDCHSMTNTMKRPRRRMAKGSAQQTHSSAGRSLSACTRLRLRLWCRRVVPHACAHWHRAVAASAGPRW